MRAKPMFIFLGIFSLMTFIGLGFVAAAPDENTLYIGCVLDLSGTTAYFDMPIYEGVKLAVDEINAAGGIGGKYKIKLAAKDYRLDAPTAVAMTKALLDDGVNVIVGPTPAPYAIVVGNLAKKKEVPSIFPTASQPDIAKAIGPFGFNVTVADNLQAGALAKYAIEQGYKTAYLFVSPDDAYTEFLPKYFSLAFKKLGGRIVGATTFSFGQQEFLVEARKIKSLKPAPDVILSAAFGHNYAGIIKGLRMAGVKAPYFGTDGIDEPSALGLGPVTEGVVFSTSSFPSPGSSMEAFNKKYKEKYGKDNKAMFSALGYDAVKIIEAGVLNAKSTNGKDLRDAMATLKDVQGATSTITYAGTDRNANRKVAVCKMQNGKKVLVKWVTLSPEEIIAPF